MDFLFDIEQEAHYFLLKKYLGILKREFFSALLCFIGVFLIGIGTTWIRILLQAVQLMATDSDYNGRMATYRMLFNQGSVVIGGPLFGWIATHYGVNYVYLSLCLPISICLLFSWKVQSKQTKFIELTEAS